MVDYFPSMDSGFGAFQKQMKNHGFTCTQARRRRSQPYNFTRPGFSLQAIPVWVRECGCVCEYVCEYVGEYVGVWVCGCVSVWVCGCVGVWVCGCVGVWVFG